MRWKRSRRSTTLFKDRAWAGVSRPGASGGSTRVFTPAHGWVLLAVGQAPVSTAGGRLAPARDLGGRRVRNRVGLGHALERELRFLAVAFDVDDDDLARPQLAEEDLLGQHVLDRPLDRAAQRPGPEDRVVAAHGEQG